jgi:hypothetical protein
MVAGLKSRSSKFSAVAPHACVVELAAVEEHVRALVDADGQPHSLYDFCGRPIYIEDTAAW